jgi:hypothetical protein
MCDPYTLKASRRLDVRNDIDANILLQRRDRQRTAERHALHGTPVYLSFSRLLFYPCGLLLSKLYVTLTTPSGFGG